MNRNIYLIFVYLDWLLKFFKFYGGYKMVENNQEISEIKKELKICGCFHIYLSV